MSVWSEKSWPAGKRKPQPDEGSDSKLKEFAKMKRRKLASMPNLNAKGYRRQKRSVNPGPKKRINEQQHYCALKRMRVSVQQMIQIAHSRAWQLSRRVGKNRL